MSILITERIPTIPLSRYKPKNGRTLGVMAAGGHCPGLNEVAAAVVNRLSENGINALGIFDSWDSLMTGGIATTRLIDFRTIDREHLNSILIGQPGTKIGTSRKMQHRSEFCLSREIREKLGIEGLIWIGWDGTARGLQNLHYPGLLPCNNAPKTMDNDAEGSDITFGFMTAREKAAEALYNMVGEVHTKGGIGIVELYGRNNGRITAESAALVDPNILCLIHEFPITREHFLDCVRSRIENSWYAVIAVSEGFYFQGEAQSTGEGTDGAWNPRFSWVAEVIKKTLFDGGLGTARTLAPTVMIRSTAPNETDAKICTMIGNEVARLAVNKVWGQSLAIKTHYDTPGSATLRIIKRPLWEVAEGNFIRAEEYDIKNLRLYNKYAERARISHSENVVVYHDEISYEVMRQKDQEACSLVASEIDRFDCGGNVSIPRWVIDFDAEASKSRECPTRWRGYMMKKLGI